MSSDRSAAAGRNGSAGGERELREDDIVGIELVPRDAHAPHSERRPLSNGDHDSCDGGIELVPRLVHLDGEISLLAVVLLQQLGHDERIGKQLSFELLLRDDLVQDIRIDRRGALEREHDFLGSCAGLDLERHTAAVGGDVLDAVLDLRLQVVVVHQPRTQRFQPRVSPLLVEDASMPLRPYFLLNVTGRRRALEPYLDERAASHLQGQLRGLGLDDSLESNL